MHNIEDNTEDLSDLSTNSVYRTIKILESLSVNSGVTLEELAPLTDLARPTLFRFLSILQRLDYVEKNKDNRYRLTARLFSVAARSVDDVELSQIAKPFMENLSFNTGETVVLCILDDNYALHLRTVASRYEQRFYERIGKRSPLYCTVVGRVLLSGMNEEEFTKYISRERLIPYTANTITNPIKLRENIESVKALGYSETINEYEQDIHSLGCPIYDHEGKIIAALNINWPLFRETPGKREECLNGLLEAGKSISTNMGYVISTK